MDFIGYYAGDVGIGKLQTLGSYNFAVIDGNNGGTTPITVPTVGQIYPRQINIQSSI